MTTIDGKDHGYYMAYLFAFRGGGGGVRKRENIFVCNIVEKMGLIVTQH